MFESSNLAACKGEKEFYVAATNRELNVLNAMYQILYMQNELERIIREYEIGAAVS